MPGTILSGLHELTHLIIIGKYQYSHITDEETDVKFLC